MSKVKVIFVALVVAALAAAGAGWKWGKSGQSHRIAGWSWGDHADLSASDE